MQVIILWFFRLSDIALYTFNVTFSDVLGEASVSLFWDNNDWMKFPENMGHQEPLYIVPHYVHHIIPDAKLIIMLRDPVER